MAVRCPRFCAPHTRSRGQIKHSHKLAKLLFRKAIPSLIEDKQDCQVKMDMTIQS
jgi:hypothetical protein